MLSRILLLLIGSLVALTAAAQLATRKDGANGVTVAVTPRNVAADAKVWEFSVVLDTHSQELSDDLAKNAVLLDAKGGKAGALGWEGAGPGGHHRAGVLKFRPLSPRPAALELRLQRPGEKAPRVFRWDLQ